MRTWLFLRLHTRVILQKAVRHCRPKELSCICIRNVVITSGFIKTSRQTRISSSEKNGETESEREVEEITQYRDLKIKACLNTFYDREGFYRWRFLRGDFLLYCGKAGR